MLAVELGPMLRRPLGDGGVGGGDVSDGERLRGLFECVLIRRSGMPRVSGV